MNRDRFIVSPHEEVPTTEQEIGSQVQRLRGLIERNKATNLYLREVQQRWMRQLPNFASMSDTPLVNFVSTETPEGKRLYAQVPSNIRKEIPQIQNAIQNTSWELGMDLEDENVFVGTVQSLNDKELEELGIAPDEIMILRYLFGPRPKE